MVVAILLKCTCVLLRGQKVCGHGTLGELPLHMQGCTIILGNVPHHVKPMKKCCQNLIVIFIFLYVYVFTEADSYIDVGVQRGYGRASVMERTLSNQVTWSLYDSLVVGEQLAMLFARANVVYVD